MYHKYIKRFFDIILSLCCIIVSSPILLVTALLVRIKLGSPVIFKQERPGYHNEIFTLYKFRSMTDAVDENGDLLPDKERLPRFGQMLSCLLYTSPSPRDRSVSRMPSSA